MKSPKSMSSCAITSSSSSKNESLLRGIAIQCLLCARLSRPRSSRRVNLELAQEGEAVISMKRFDKNYNDTHEIDVNKLFFIDKRCWVAQELKWLSQRAQTTSGAFIIHNIIAGACLCFGFSLVLFLGSSVSPPFPAKHKHTTALILRRADLTVSRLTSLFGRPCSPTTAACAIWGGHWTHHHIALQTSRTKRTPRLSSMLLLVE